MNIAPETRLLWLVALGAIPLCTVAGVAPTLLLPCVALLLLLGAVAAVDAVRARRPLEQLRITAPSTLRWFHERPAELPLQVTNASGSMRRVRLALDMPREIACEPAFFAAIVGATAAFTAKCLPRERGRFELAACHVENRSPFGFWRARGQLPVTTEIRIYPDLRRERGAELLTARQQVGLHHQRQAGKGREFEKLREYVHGDSFDEIHWKASARRGRPVVKVFQVERMQEVYAIVDASRLSARGGVMDRYVNAALGLALAAESQGDRFGLVTFSAGIDRFVRAANGKQHFAACRDAIYTVQPRRVSPDFDELFTFLQLRLRRRALLVFLTSLDDPVLAESFVRDVRLLRRHLIVVSVPGQSDVRPLFTGPAPADVDGIYRELAAHLQWTKLEELRKTLEREGIRLSVNDPVTLMTELARQYFSIKQRQLL